MGVGDKHLHRRFPGLYRPGLIGAGAAGRLEAHHRVGFRGFTAPASLELGERRRRTPRRQGFPGLYRPGLIGAAA